ncbi:gephyrin-like molybdotransferase receptor GlpR [Streptomyces buecherae]|uniref:divisome protein SepX/GlpR n=1 Tax=Streptomyces buecherae TaxID=2763006 RepID=UPI0033C38A65
MSSSGLIYAVIVGAWAAYLVPMWLRRQDELNDARPTERFSTAIRLLSGRAAMERRYTKGLDVGELPEAASDDAPTPVGAAADAAPDPHAPDRAPVGVGGPDGETDIVDVRAFAHPATMTVTVTDALLADPAERPPAGPDGAAPTDGPPATGEAEAPGRRDAGAGADGGAGERTRRAKVLARRRRTTVLLFLAFTVGSIVAAVGGVAFLWAPVGPAVLLSAYIVYLRMQERRRFAFTMDQRRAELAAQRLREQRGRPASGSARQGAPGAQPGDGPADGPAPDHGPGADRRPDRPTPPHPTPPRPAGDRPRPERRGPARASAGMPRQPGSGSDQARRSAPGDEAAGQSTYEGERGPKRPHGGEPAPRAHDGDPTRRAGAAAGRPAPDDRREGAAPSAPSEAARSTHAADRRALVEQTDHAEWVDERERERGGAAGQSWDPVPVPLPTYVTAPVAPRATADADLGAPDNWSPSRSSAAEPTDGPTAPADPVDPSPGDPTQPPAQPGTGSRRPARDRGRTPLFDQYADESRPRAANE